MAWIGRKKIAFIPVFRPHAVPPDAVPADWAGDILQRVFFDPDQRTGADRSLRRYIQNASSGRADLDAVVLPMVVIDRQKVDLKDPDVQQLGSSARSQGFDAAAIVMLGGPGAGTAEQGGFLARFVMREPLGVWAMELMHVLTGFADIRCFGNFADCPDGAGDIGNFDEMAQAGGVHPSAFTKAAIQWLDASAIARHKGRAAGYDLHSVGLVQPPPTGRSTAVRIGSSVPHLMVEARTMVDQFESPSRLESGIPSQGVIVYRVQTTDPHGNPQGPDPAHPNIPVFLLTPTALAPGQTFTSDSNVTVSVAGAIPGGFTVAVEDRNASFDKGSLLSYGDAGTPGNVSNPTTVGFGGWLGFKFLFAGTNLPGQARIYAVDQGGQLLSYGDAGTPGNVSSPAVVGFGGWQAFKFLFAGKNVAGENRIYAVNQQGQLLSYGDSGTPGNVSSPVIVGFGGWLAFKFLFCGRNLAGQNRIYAVDQQGQLLSYGDAGTPGNVSSPVVVGFGGWQAFKFLFAGKNVAGADRIYAVDQQGQLLSYGDAGTPGNVSSPVVVGLGGWQAFRFIFAGGNLGGQNRIYAVVA
jgi:negative regulator of replication initiation